MAPARMVQFIKQHVEECAVCLEDPDIQGEIEKITEIVLPESKIPKAVRMKQELEEARIEQVEEVAAEQDTESEDESEEVTETTDKYADEEEELEEPLTPDSASS